MNNPKGKISFCTSNVTNLLIQYEFIYAYLYTQSVHIVFLHTKHLLFLFAILGLKETTHSLAYIFLNSGHSN